MTVKATNVIRGVAVMWMQVRDPNQRMNQYPWFFGKIDREEAVRKVMGLRQVFGVLTRSFICDY